MHQTTFSVMPRPQIEPVLSTSEQPPSLDICSRGPVVDGFFDPRGNRDGSHMPTFADQVDDRPVFLSLLQVLDRQVNQLRASQTAA